MRKEQEQEVKEEQQQLSSPSIIYELSSMIIHVLKPIPNSSSSRQQPPLAFLQVSLAAFASLFLGVSLVLMLFGSIAFVIGFILMPWVVGFVLLFYLAGFVTTLSGLAQSIFCSRDVPGK